MALAELTSTDESRGLAESEVESRRARGLGNDVPIQTSRSYGQIVRENVLTFINLVIFFLGVLLVILGRTSDALVSVGVISVNVAVALVSIPHLLLTTKS